MKLNSNPKSTLNSNSAQASIEYLLIIGVIVVCGLLVVGVFLGILGSTSNSPHLTEAKFKQTIGSQTIGLSDAVVDQNGDALFVLVNNTDYTIRLMGYNVDEEEFDLGTGVLFYAHEKKLLFFANIGSCNGIDSCLYKQIIFRYSVEGSAKVLNSGGTDYVLNKALDVTAP
ncbi:MAG: hypothetical protein WCW13_02585 [archaeon]|jgi:hypothetical protein